MKYVLYFGFWIAVFYAVIKFGMSVIEEQERQSGESGEGSELTDPVCGMKIGDTNISSQFEGKTYYFCAEVCKNAFEKEPRRYAKS